MAAPRLRAEVRPGQGRAGLGWSHTGLSTWPALREQRVPPWLPILMLGRSPKPREFKGRWAVGRAWCPGRTWAGMHSSVDVELWKPARVLTGPEMRHTDAPHDGPRGPGPRRWRPLPGRQAAVLPRQGSPRMTSLTGVCAGPPSRFRTTALAIRVRWPMFPRLMPPAALGVTGTIRAAAGPGSHPHSRSVSPRPRLRDAGSWRAAATWQPVTPSHARPHDAGQRTQAPRASELTLHAPPRAAPDRGPSPTPRCHRAALAPEPCPGERPATQQQAWLLTQTHLLHVPTEPPTLCGAQGGTSLSLALWPHKSPPQRALRASGTLALRPALPGAHGSAPCAWLHTRGPAGGPQVPEAHTSTNAALASEGGACSPTPSLRLAHAQRGSHGECPS